jgi:hypothetical protein
VTETESDSTASGWVAWILFAAAIVIIAGVFNIVDGLVAMFRDEILLDTGPRLLVFDVTQWGWILLIFGTLQVVVGAFLLRGVMWARIAAVILAGLNAVAQLSFMAAHPVWATIVIALDVVVIWAVTVHGGELREAISPTYR